MVGWSAVAGFLGGFVVGMVLMAYGQIVKEKEAERSGYIKVNQKIYRIEEIGK